MTLHNTILKRIQLIVLALLYGLAARAQTTEKYGTFFDDAIPITLSGNKSTFTDRRNTDKKPSGSHFYYIFRYIPPQGSEYRYTQGKAVYYQLDLPLPGNLIIHNWKTDYSAGPGYTTLHVLRKTQKGETEDWSEGELSFKWVATFEEHDFMDPGFSHQSGYAGRGFLRSSLLKYPQSIYRYLLHCYSRLQVFQWFHSQWNHPNHCNSGFSTQYP